MKINGGDKCVLYVNSKDEYKNQWVLGDSFLRSYCTNYSFKDRQIGLSKAIHA